jgi:hypothetical protein
VVEPFCRDHQGVEAVAGCSRCGRALCALCQFQFDGLPFCPDCATAGPSPTERSKVFGGGLLSLALAVLGFVIVAGFVVAGASGTSVDGPIGSLLSMVAFGSGLGGVVAGLVARDGARRTGSLLPVVGLVTSGILVAILLVFSVLGSGR